MQKVTHPFYSYSYGNRKGSKDPSIAIERLTREEEDRILDSYPELINPNYRGWFIKRLRAKGKSKFTQLADHALKYGTDKQKMFVHLVE